MIEWLDEALNRGCKEQFVVPTVEIGPELASELLKLNGANRTVSKARVARYVRAIKTGDFVHTHQGMAVSRGRRLLDGQHRLLAVIQAEQAIHTMVSFGAPDDNFRHIDTPGGVRNSADALGILGYAMATDRASVGRLLYLPSRGVAKAEAHEVVAFVECLDQAILDDAISCGRRLNAPSRKVCTVSMGGVAYYWIRSATKHPGDLEEFFDGLIVGAELDPLRAGLRDWLKNKAPPTAGGNQGLRRSAAIIFGWNGWIKGQKRFAKEWGNHISVMQLPLPE